MKKFLALFTVFAFAFALAACTEDLTTTAEQTTAEQTTAAPDKTVVTYMGWNVGTEEQNNIVRRRIAAFNEMSDTIEIQIVEYEGDYNTVLATKAAAGEFPDITMSADVPGFIINGYAADISDIVAADDEWQDVPVALRNSITYGDGMVFAIPSAQFYMSFMINVDLIEDSGVLTDFTEPGYTVDEWLAALEAVTDTTHTDGTSTIGMTHPGDIVNWLPAVLDAESEDPIGIQHFAYAPDGIFHLNSQPVKDAIETAYDISQNGWVVSSYSSAAQGTEENPLPSVRSELFGSDWDMQPFLNGQTAFHFEGSWSAGWVSASVGDLFDLQYVALPGGYVIGVSDYLTISNTSENKEAAYEAAKWLSFGKDGILEALDIVANTVPDTENGEATLSLDGLPINNDQAVIDAWFVDYPMSGVKELYEQVAAGDVTVLVEGFKYVPGFSAARWGFDTGIEGATTSRPSMDPGATLSIGDFIWDAQFGLIVYADYMTQEMENLVNYEFVKAQLALAVALQQY